ncbi:hypothetical protein Poli38472_002142 [Pythium oligandrum]|uniref:CRAL-TRIO domain-containing protein n=1 Tax=Pythium oligandrum TaxID=41045 RepID=A0A8K1CGP6_PYTOL|nr:hypothetical protein Poli38472_002142 [Pythium oligandrum]|eukprot:TMW63201.1 hypothetical protein Poli38472_002142 [Pythium oligandrum]
MPMAPAGDASRNMGAATHDAHGGSGSGSGSGSVGMPGRDHVDTQDAVSRPRRSSSVESALSLVSDDVVHRSGMMGGCCRGYSARLLFLMGCAMIEYVAHTVILILGPMIALHFYPTTSYPRIGFYTALLSGAGYFGNMLSCRLWINMARSLKSSKGVILWGLSILGTGYFSLLLCQSLLAMTIVRFATGLFSGVTPVALIEIDNICGNRQTRLAAATKYFGILIGASVTLVLVGFGGRLFKLSERENDETEFFFYPLCFVSIMSWVAVVITLIGLRMKSRASYVPLTSEGDANFKQQRRSALDDSPRSLSPSTGSSSLDRVKSAFEETFRRNPKQGQKDLLSIPRPHFRMIRSILPHYYHGYTSEGHVVIWDFIGQVKMDRLTSGGFTTVDIRSHYEFFIQFALEKLVKSSGQKIMYIVDLEGLTLMDVDDRVVESASTIVAELQKAFPDRLAQIAVLNTPVWFSQVMAGLRPNISKRTLDKVRFLPIDSTAQDLLDIIGVDSLPKRYGGRNGVEMGKSSQERALNEHLRQTTGSLEDTIEIIKKAAVRPSRSGSLRSDDDGSDEEAFFDCSEYGLQDAYDDDEEISIVLHSQSNHTTTEAVSRALSSPTRTQRLGSDDKKVHDLEMGPRPPATTPTRKAQTTNNNSAAPDLIADLAITREPHTVLILVFFFLWSLVQGSFDEIFPLWFFKKDPALTGNIHAAEAVSQISVSTLTLHCAASMAVMAVSFLSCQLIFCRSSSSVMTPLATLRLGLLFQIPVVGAFPLIKLFHLDSLSFASAIVVAVLLLKHLTAAIATHGMVTLLDNSIAADRRLVAHRAGHMVAYVASFMSAGGAPALFALLGYFEKSFPFDQSLLYFVQALGLVFLFFFSCLIPSRLNFPMLFSMSKR